MELQFLRDLTHELNNSLTILWFNFEEIEKKLTWNKHFHNILIEHEVISKSLKDHLLLHELKNKIIKLEKINLSNLINKIASKYHLIIKSKFNYSIEDNVYILWKKDLLEIVIKELIENAIKHSNERTRVNLFLSKKLKKSILEIQNNSKWFRNCETKDIFKKYYRGYFTKIKKLRWTWIWLTLAKLIVNKIWAKITASTKKAETRINVQFDMI